MQTIIRHLKRFGKARKGVSNVIVVMLSLILVTLIVSNVVLWSYQMNQFDLERMQENIKIENVTRVTHSSWFTINNEYIIEVGSRNGTYVDTQTVDDIYESFMEENGYIYNPSTYNPVNSTQHVSGLLIDLENDDANYMTFRSYASRNITGAFGNNAPGPSSTIVSANAMYGSLFTSPPATVIAKSIAFYGRSVSQTRSVKCLIVRHSDLKIVAITNPVSVTTTLGWWTATFSDSPTLTPNTEYLLMMIPNGQVRFYYTTGSANQGHYDTTNNYASPIDPTDASHNTNRYSIYCNYDQPVEYTAEVEFMGTSNMETWNSLTWKVTSSFTTDNVNVTLQLFNYQTNNYPEDGDGYMSYISSSIPNVDETKKQTITENATQFRDGSSNWKLRIKGVKATNAQFDLKLDLAELKTEMQDAYALSMTGEFTLDIKTYPPQYIETLEIQIRLRANDTIENWFLKVYNWTTAEFANVSQIIPATNFEYYTVSITENWQSFINNEGTVRIMFCDANLDASQTTVDIDFFAVRAKIDGAKFSVKNSGSATAHIVVIWVVNATVHTRYEANYFVNVGEEATFIRADIKLPEGDFIVKVVTERGNIAVFIP
ncbi:MAG: hypothetical protein ACPL0C_00225 [Candidatus Bathyarchaeales archaeon]